MYQTYSVKYVPSNDNKEDKKREENGDSLTNIAKYRKNKLSVTDLSAQIWCEKQLELTLITGRKRESKEMTYGVKRHGALELLDHDIKEVTVETKEDIFAFRLLNSITLLNQLIRIGRAREVWVVSELSQDIILRGVIDELEIITDEEGNKKIKISDTKTRKVASIPSLTQQRTSAMQLYAYRWMLNKSRKGGVDFSVILKVYKLEREMNLTHSDLCQYGTLGTLVDMFISTAKELPPIDDVMQLNYEHDEKQLMSKSIPFSKIGFHYTLDVLMDWWLSKREADSPLISEKWKCKNCIFVAECDKTPLEIEEYRIACENQREIRNQELKERRQVNESEENEIQELRKEGLCNSESRDKQSLSKEDRISDELISAQEKLLDIDEYDDRMLLELKNVRRMVRKNKLLIQYEDEEEDEDVLCSTIDTILQLRDSDSSQSVCVKRPDYPYTRKSESGSMDEKDDISVKRTGVYMKSTEEDLSQHDSTNDKTSDNDSVCESSSEDTVETYANSDKKSNSKLDSEAGRKHCRAEKEFMAHPKRIKA